MSQELANNLKIPKSIIDNLLNKPGFVDGAFYSMQFHF